jgi:7-dehydrocholesterol reductase
MKLPQERHGETVKLSLSSVAGIGCNTIQDVHQWDTPRSLWGRNNQASWVTSAFCIFIFTVPLMLTIFGCIALNHFQGSLSKALWKLYQVGLLDFLSLYVSAPSLAATWGYLAWAVFQAVLYTCLPGRSNGQLTPAGHLLEYRTNGLLACIMTLITTASLHFYGLFDLVVIADHWQELVIVLNISGFLITAIAFLKAHFSPSHPKDRKFSGTSGSHWPK